MTNPVITLNQIGKDGEKQPPVAVSQKEFSLGIPTSSHMIEGTGKLNPKWSSHAINLPERILKYKT
jgi:hypothetical protein